MIREELSVVVPREVKDPRVPSVTFTQVQVTPDGEQATVLVTILGGAQGGYGDEAELSEGRAKKRMEDCLEGLRSASGYLRKHLAKVLTIRHIPVLVFKEDKGLANTQRVHELLKQISGEKPVSAESVQDTSSPDKEE